MPSTKRRVTAKLDRFRGRHHKLDHVIRMVTHYGSVDGNAQAGAVTFFGFLSIFPILALVFFAVGVIAHVYPDLRADIRVTIENLLPGVVGSDDGEIPLRTFENYAATVGLVGLLGVLYSGLGWISGMRVALETMFVLPKREQPNFVFGKLRDVGTLLLLGVVLLFSVALSGAVAGFSERLLDWVDVDPDGVVPNAVLWVLSHGLAIAASTVLLLALFKFLAQPHVPRRSLFDGALLGAVGFELLKAAAYFLIEQTKGNPAFQAFGVSLILLIWINYFSRLVLYAASYAYTSPAAVRLREARSVAAESEAAEVGPERSGPEALPDTKPREYESAIGAAPAPASSPLAPGGRHPAAGPRGRGTVAAVGAVVAATGAAAVLARRRARMSR